MIPRYTNPNKYPPITSVAQCAPRKILEMETVRIKKAERVPMKILQNKEISFFTSITVKRKPKNTT
jgi:hypothetical protein